MPRPSKPAFQSVLDLGLRDVGVQNDARRHAAFFGKASAQVFLLVVLSSFAACVFVGVTRGGPGVAVALALATTAGMVVLAVRASRRSAVLVVRVTAEGAGLMAWLPVASFPLFALTALLSGHALLIPLVVLLAIATLAVWRTRGRVPALLREFRPVLAADESVLGDGAGLAAGARGWHEAFRLVVATDRRLLVATPARSSKAFLMLDVPYARVGRFGIEWKYRGRVGSLSLTVAGADGEPSETRVINAIVPANLLSIALALQSHGVEADDPAAVSEAERGWEEAKRRSDPRKPLCDVAAMRAAMSTREFDHGLWLFLGVLAVSFYVPPFNASVGAGGLALIVLVLGGVCGYLSRSKSSLAYLVPLNLLLSPNFLFMDANRVLLLMLGLSAIAAAGLWGGPALRARTGRAGAPAIPGPRPARGSLRHAINGLGLIRLTGFVLAGVMALVVTASAAGFELTDLRLAFQEATLTQVPVDGRSNLTGGAASLTYTPGPDLHEFITDENSDTTDGAQWELRSSFTEGFNVVSLAYFVNDPPLADAASVAGFVAGKDRQHSRLAGYHVTHTERVVDGHKGYVWSHGSLIGYWFYAAWFVEPGHRVRVECIAKRQVGRFKRLCAEAVGSLKLR